MTDKQRHVLRHALGLGLSKTPYRNRFTAAGNSDNHRVCEELVEAGLMERGRYDRGLASFFVTPAGAAAIGAPWEAPP